MLTYADEAQIRHIIMTRLHQDGKTEIADIQINNVPTADPPYIQVGVWFILKDRIGIEGLIDPRSFFDLPAEFTRAHLLNEIDEISEHLKVVRTDTQRIGLVYKPDAAEPRKAVAGTGLRGRWGQDGKGAGARALQS